MPSRPPKQSAKAQKAHQRLARAWYQHPIATLSAGLTLIGAVVSAGPAFLWLANYYETRSHADEREAALKTAIKMLRTEEERTNLWQQVQLIRNEAVLLRNRTNDCEIAQARGKDMTKIEREACTQYQTELKSAQARFETARNAALAVGKEKTE